MGKKVLNAFDDTGPERIAPKLRSINFGGSLVEIKTCASRGLLSLMLANGACSVYPQLLGSKSNTGCGTCSAADRERRARRRCLARRGSAAACAGGTDKLWSSEISMNLKKP